MSAVAIVLGTNLSSAPTVYGRVPAGQYVSPGSNKGDTIVVTVNDWMYGLERSLVRFIFHRVEVGISIALAVAGSYSRC